MTVSAMMSSWVGCCDKMMAAAAVGAVEDAWRESGAVTTAPTTAAGKRTPGYGSGTAPAICGKKGTILIDSVYSLHF